MSDKRTREHIVAAADDLFYRQGYEHTSFADIAAAVRISRGNFYYHFKTKDDILRAVIDYRREKTQQMLEHWQAEGASACERIRSFIEILIANRAKIMRYGCPVGTLSAELAKLDHGSQAQARQLLAMFRQWLAQQFVELGCEDSADTLAMHVLARSQGVAAMASAFNDAAFIEREVQSLHDWLDAQCQKPRRRARRTATQTGA